MFPPFRHTRIRRWVSPSFPLTAKSCFLFIISVISTIAFFFGFSIIPIFFTFPDVSSIFFITPMPARKNVNIYKKEISTTTQGLVFNTLSGNIKPGSFKANGWVGNDWAEINLNCQVFLLIYCFYFVYPLNSSSSYRVFWFFYRVS